MSDWTPAATDLTTLLWADGKSASEISRELWDRLGFYASRNAIIGKVHRLRLPKRKTVLTPKAQARKGAGRARTALDKPRPRIIRPKPQPRLRAAPIPRRSIPMEAPKPMNLTIMQLTSRTCKWPVNDPPKGEAYLFCGEAKEPGKEPYCPYHARLAEGTGTPSERRVYREMGRRAAA